MTDALALKAITEELEDQQEKLKKLEEKLKELPEVKANIEALTRSLAILRGDNISNKKEEKEASILFPIKDNQRALREGSTSYIAYSILKSGSPLTPNELFETVKVKKTGLSKNSFLSGIYTFIRDKKYFAKDGTGKITILK
jgi:hypothetical protein